MTCPKVFEFATANDSGFTLQVDSTWVRDVYVSLVLKEGNCTTRVYKHIGFTSKPHRNLPPCDGSVRICLQWKNVNALPSAGQVYAHRFGIAKVYTTFPFLEAWWYCECHIALRSAVATRGVCCKRPRILRRGLASYRLCNSGDSLAAHTGSSWSPVLQPKRHSTWFFSPLVHRKNTVVVSYTFLEMQKLNMKCDCDGGWHKQISELGRVMGQLYGHFGGLCGERNELLC